MDVCGAASVRVPRPRDVVLSALAFRAWPPFDAVHLERLSAIADVPARHRARDLRPPRKFREPVSACGDTARPNRRTLRPGGHGQPCRDDGFLSGSPHAGIPRWFL